MDGENHDHDDLSDNQIEAVDNTSVVIGDASDTTVSENAIKKNDAANSPLSYAWKAPEFIAYDKNSVWYFYLLITCLVLCAVVYLLIKDIVTIAVIVVAFFLIGLYGSRKPRDTQYSVDATGLKVGKRSYSYASFRNFSSVNEGQYSSIILLPLKRFALSVSLYFPTADQDKILNVVSENLPVEQHKPDLVDRLMTRIRF